MSFFFWNKKPEPHAKTTTIIPAIMVRAGWKISGYMVIEEDLPLSCGVDPSHAYFTGPHVDDFFQLNLIWAKQQLLELTNLRKTLPPIIKGWERIEEDDRSPIVKLSTDKKPDPGRPAAKPKSKGPRCPAKPPSTKK